MNIEEVLENPEDFTKEMVKDIREREHKLIFGRHKCVFNLREVKSECCSDCEYLMEDLVHEGGMVFYICPFQSDTDILNYNLVCDKFKLATTEPEKTERRKSMMDFTERLQYNSDNPGKDRLNILNKDEIKSLMSAMENGELDEKI